MSAFDAAFDRLIGNEGGYQDGSGDPGGETNWGISKRSYPALDIKALTREDAKTIYHRDFWRPTHCGDAPSPVDFELLDFAVNSGSQTAIRYLQRALGVADDGHWGPITQAAVNATVPARLAARLLALRLDFMSRLSNWPAAGEGWARRIARNLLVDNS